MNVTVKNLPKSQIQLTVALTPDEWGKYRTQALRKLAQKMKIPGFRQGHIPEKVLLQHIGPEVIFSEAADLALQQTYVAAIRQENLEPIAQPEVNITAVEPFTFEATVDVMPHAEVTELKKVKLKKGKIEVSKKEIDDTVEFFREQVAERKPVERAAKKGDIAIINFQGFDLPAGRHGEGGVQLEGTQGKQHPVEIGAKRMIPGFEEELVGLKKGEQKSFQLTFPKDYHARNFANKKVRFDVTVQEVEEKILPEVNEAFVEKITGSKKSVVDFKKEIEDSLRQKKEQERRREHESILLEAVEKNVRVELPEILINEEVEYLIDNLKMQGLQQGITWENYLVHLKKSEAELQKELRPQAEKQVRTRLGIRAFLEADQTAATDAEIEHEVQHTLQRMPEKQRAEQKALFAKGARGWEEARHRIRIGKWIEQKLKSFTA